MDLNRILHNHQVALINARAVNSGEGGAVYLELARYYAQRLRDYRSEASLSQYS